MLGGLLLAGLIDGIVRILIPVSIIAGAVVIGTVGYHSAGRLGWLDAFLNASMILSGMGPVDRMENTAGKLFSALYALFSGLVFVGATGIIIAPWAHRLFHWIHIEGGA